MKLTIISPQMVFGPLTSQMRSWGWVGNMSVRDYQQNPNPHVPVLRLPKITKVRAINAQESNLGLQSWRAGLFY